MDGAVFFGLSGFVLCHCFFFSERCGGGFRLGTFGDVSSVGISSPIFG